MTLPVVLAIAGSIALLVGLFGGGVKAKEIEVPKISALPRISSSIFGLLLIGTAIWLSLPPSDATSQQPTEAVIPEISTPTRISPTIEPTQQPTSTSIPDTVVPPTPAPPTSIPVSPTPSTLDLQFMIDESGWVTQGGQVGTGSEHPPQAGDFNNNAVARGFLSFDLMSIPSNATIQSARLILPQSAKGDGDVFPNFGSLTFEAVWYGLSLNPEAFDSPGYFVLQNAYGPTSTIGVAAGVEKAIQQGHRRFQIRFSFSLGTDNDGSGENYWIPDPPSLEVVYSVP